ncbi:hypothetical protein PSPO01_11868 [Paraphaeosphaeria sporulosa]
MSSDISHCAVDRAWTGPAARAEDAARAGRRAWRWEQHGHGGAVWRAAEERAREREGTRQEPKRESRGGLGAVHAWHHAVYASATSSPPPAIAAQLQPASNGCLGMPAACNRRWQSRIPVPPQHERRLPARVPPTGSYRRRGSWRPAQDRCMTQPLCSHSKLRRTRCSHGAQNRFSSSILRLLRRELPLPLFLHGSSHHQLHRYVMLQTCKSHHYCCHITQSTHALLLLSFQT